MTALLSQAADDDFDDMHGGVDHVAAPEEIVIGLPLPQKVSEAV